MDIERKKLLISFRFPFILAVLMVAAFIYSHFFRDLYFLGIFPMEKKGLIGIITSIFIHGDLSHLAGNLVPLILLSTALFYYYRKFALQAVVLMWLTTGFWVWIMARPNYHIGASGLVYALASFHVVSALIRRDYRLVAFAMLVIFLYGSLIWGIFPEFYPEKNISWEGHLMGGIAGIVYAIYYRKKDTDLAEKKDYFEDEEDDELGSDYIWPDEFYDKD